MAYSFIYWAIYVFIYLFIYVQTEIIVLNNITVILRPFCAADILIIILK